MPWKYNPFTDALDNVGSGGGTSYIDGDVEYHSNLPVTVGSPAVNSAFLVRKGEGLYFISRKPAGIWVRELNNGNLDDWKYAGTFSDLYRDANFRILNNADVSKELAFDVSGVTTGTTRTLTVPDASGRIQVEGQPIGNTTPAAGTFTTLAANNGTLTASAPVLDLAQTWNNSGTTFQGLNLDVTNTASANASALLNMSLNGGTLFSIRRGGSSAAATVVTGGGSGLAWTASTRTGSGVGVNFQNTLGIGSRLEFLATATTTTGGDVHLVRDATDALALQRTTNAQTFRIYNTFTSDTNHERGFLKWSSNVFQIGTEKGSGGGTARDLVFQTDGTTRATINANGLFAANIATRVFTARDSQPPSTGFATLDTRGTGIAVLDFDDAATESAVFVSTLPRSATIASGLVIELRWMATSATSGNVRWSVAIERCNTDLDSDSFDTSVESTAACNATSGIITATSITITTIDSLAVGELFRLRVQRLGADAADTMTGDAELVAVEIRSAA
jgi:hypothetical protein